MIGGILLFPDSLEEDVDNLYPTSDNLPVAYASNDVNSTSDLQRGELSQTEGGATDDGYEDDGYEFVWEFSNTQGNGTIAAVALTSAQGGCGEPVVFQLPVEPHEERDAGWVCLYPVL